MLHLSVRCVISLFFLEKQSEIRNTFTFFEKWKVKKIILSLFLRNEKWNDFFFHSFREVKVKLKYPETEIEKWNFKIILKNSRESRLLQVTVFSDHFVNLQKPYCPPRPVVAMGSIRPYISFFFSGVSVLWENLVHQILRQNMLQMFEKIATFVSFV